MTDTAVRRSTPARVRSAVSGASLGQVLAILYLLVLLGWTIAPGVFAWYDPIDGIPADKLQPPSPAHLFGTDALGRDVYTRVVYGTGHTLLGALIAITISGVVGGALGLLAGSRRGAVDQVIMRIADALLATPSLLLAMILVAILGRSNFWIAAAVGIGGIAYIIRLTKSSVLGVRTQTFVEGARISGSGPLHVMGTHILPSAYRPVVAALILEFGSAITWIATLSFLGYGEPPPQPDWGVSLAEGRNLFLAAPWLVWAPSIVIVLTVLSVNTIAHDSQSRELQ